MIGRLTGTLVEKQPPWLLLDVNGIGYEIEAPMTTFYNLPDTGETITLFTHLAIRDDAHLLFGFGSEQEKHLFRTLIKVNGVGVKMALTILSGIEAKEFALCIQNNDVARLVKLPGVGKKTAERLVIEMRDKLSAWDDTSADSANNDTPTKTLNDPCEEAVSALIGLGYKPQEASRFVHAVASEDMNSEEIIREALKSSVK